MSFLDSVKESLVSASKDVTQKAKEVSGVAKLKLDIKTKEDFVEKQYAILGHSYFDAHKDDEENAENEQFKVIKEALSEIESMKAEILKLQGAAECPNCGAKVPQDAAYCSSCGTRRKPRQRSRHRKWRRKRSSRNRLTSFRFHAMLSNGHLNRITLGKREYIIWNCTERFPEAFGKEISEAGC